MKELGIYVHIPFCVKKCDYCDFISYTHQEKYYQRYIKAIVQEIKNLQVPSEYEITTIYLGGGTPSILPKEYIEEIMQAIKNHLLVQQDAEITIECNPGTVTLEKLQTYYKCGINRISIGLQETHNHLLKQIGRIHTYEEFLQTFEWARKAGFHNINVDLMIALPNQTMQDVEENLQKLIELQPEHISIYSLIIEEGTKMEQDLQNKVIELPSEEMERNMYWKVKRKLEQAGYRHYEISNFAKPNFESRHNCNCWEQQEYLGMGIAAHSYFNKKRYSHITQLLTYIENCENKKIAQNNILHEVQNMEEQQKEYMLLKLRMLEGVSIQKFKEKFKQNPIYVFRKEIHKLVEEGLLEVDGDKIFLTNKGLDVANLVWEEFV